MATIHIPALLLEVTSGADQLTLPLKPGERITVRTALERLDAEHPGLLDGLLHEDELIPGIAVFINNEQALMGLLSKIDDGGDVHFIPPIVGG